MSFVFISYASAQRAQAQQIAEMLLMNHYDVWQLNSTTEERLEAAEDAFAIIFLMSGMAKADNTVTRVRQVARQMFTPVVPISLDGTVFAEITQPNTLQMRKHPPAEILTQLKGIAQPGTLRGQFITEIDSDNNSTQLGKPQELINLAKALKLGLDSTKKP